MRHQQQTITGLSIVALVLYLCSTPFFIYRYPALHDTDLQLKSAHAIVVLGQGRYRSAVEYEGKDTVSVGSLARIRYAAWLHRKTGLPILTTGGKPNGAKISEALLMSEVLQKEFGVPVRWLEEESLNTWENALFSAQILRKERITTIFLVTHGIHMARAVWSFERSGLQVIPAPTLISAGMDEVVHEYFGLLWYYLRYV